MTQTPETRLEINLKALEHNFKVVKQNLQPKTKVMGVVKAFAYGTDDIIVSKKLCDLGINFFAVAYVEEAIRLRHAGINLPIMVFYPKVEEVEDILKYNLRPSIYSLELLQDFIEVLTPNKTEEFPIHIKINTGMNRLGIDNNDYQNIAKYLQEHKYLKVTGMFSHLAASGLESENDFTKQQISKFKDAITYFKPLIKNDFITHLCNSSGILNFSEAEMGMVRAGMALYGYGNNPKEQKQLKPIFSLKTSISQLRWIEKGDTVGYDRKFIAKDKTLVATLHLGYADGISRIYSNGNGLIEVNGKLAPIIGNICMDTLMLDVTGISCLKGDTVTVFGETHTALDFDVNTKSIPYELITKISRRIPRIIVTDS